MKIQTRIAFLFAVALPVTALASSSTDGKIEDAARASYNFHTVLSGEVSVKSSDGVVTLSGTVQDKGQKAMAEDTVANLPGVLSVNNQIEVKPEYAENSDGWIALRVRSELFFKANVSMTATKVAVKDGVVTLSGTAETPAQKDLTETYVKDIPSVKSVVDNLVIVPPAAGSATVGEYIDDASITSEVKYALLSHSSTSALSTKVTTVGSVVSISGVAGSDAEKDLVTRLAQDARGVKSVVNDMTVKS